MADRELGTQYRRSDEHGELKNVNESISTRDSSANAKLSGASGLRHIRPSEQVWGHNGATDTIKVSRSRIWFSHHNIMVPSGQYASHACQTSSFDVEVRFD